MEQGKKVVKKSVRYSQNFLKSSQLIQKLVEQSSIQVNDTVIDIGAGKGIITEVLSTFCKKVIAIEADLTLIGILRQKFQNNPKIQIQTGDFFDYLLPNEPYKVFSNIPFNRTADVIRKLLNTSNSPEDAYLIVQKEAAYKFIGFPVSKESLFSITIKPWFEPSIEHNFLRLDFDPRPNIDIVLLRIKKLQTPLISDDQSNQYKDFVSYAFNKSNPNLKRGLRAVFTPNQFSRLMQTLHLTESVVPTQLSFNQWVQLFQAFVRLVDNQKRQIITGSASKITRDQSRIAKFHRTRVSKNWKKEAIF